MSHDKGSKTTLTVKTPQSQYDVNVARVKKGDGFETTCTVGNIFDMKLEEKITMGPPAGMFINSNLKDIFVNKNELLNTPRLHSRCLTCVDLKRSGEDDCTVLSGPEVWKIQHQKRSGPHGH